MANLFHTVDADVTLCTITFCYIKYKGVRSIGWTKCKTRKLENASLNSVANQSSEKITRHTALHISAYLTVRWWRQWTRLHCSRRRRRRGRPLPEGRRIHWCSCTKQRFASTSNKTVKANSSHLHSILLVGFQLFNSMDAVVCSIALVNFLWKNIIHIAGKSLCLLQYLEK